MTTAAHFRALERMYAAAPINAIYEPTMTITGATKMGAIPGTEIQKRIVTRFKKEGIEL